MAKLKEKVSVLKRAFFFCLNMYGEVILMPEEIKEVNEDELVGFIMRQAANKGIGLYYEDIRTVLDAELEFLKKKGIAENN